MKIDIHAPWSVNPFLRETITKKVEKLSKFHKNITHIDVFLKRKDTEGNGDLLTEIRVRIPGKKELFSHSTAEDFEVGINEAYAKVKRQLIKKVEQMQSK